MKKTEHTIAVFLRTIATTIILLLSTVFLPQDAANAATKKQYPPDVWGFSVCARLNQPYIEDQYKEGMEPQLYVYVSYINPANWKEYVGETPDFDVSFWVPADDEDLSFDKTVHRTDLNNFCLHMPQEKVEAFCRKYAEPGKSVWRHYYVGFWKNGKFIRSIVCTFRVVPKRINYAKFSEYGYWCEYTDNTVERTKQVSDRETLLDTLHTFRVHYYGEDKIRKNGYSEPYEYTLSFWKDSTRIHPLYIPVSQPMETYGEQELPTFTTKNTIAKDIQRNSFKGRHSGLGPFDIHLSKTVLDSFARQIKGAFVPGEPIEVYFEYNPAIPALQSSDVSRSIGYFSYIPTADSTSCGHEWEKVYRRKRHWTNEQYTFTKSGIDFSMDLVEDTTDSVAFYVMNTPATHQMSAYARREFTSDEAKDKSPITDRSLEEFTSFVDVFNEEVGKEAGFKFRVPNKQEWLLAASQYPELGKGMAEYLSDGAIENDDFENMDDDEDFSLYKGFEVGTRDKNGAPATTIQEEETSPTTCLRLIADRTEDSITPEEEDIETSIDVSFGEHAAKGNRLKVVTTRVFDHYECTKCHIKNREWDEFFFDR